MISFSTTGTPLKSVSLNKSRKLNLNIHQNEINSLQNYEEIDYSVNPDYDLDNEVETWYDRMLQTTQEVGATVTVGATSVLSGILNVGENIVDGAIWVGGGVASLVTSIFNQDLANDIKEGTMDVIAYDAVGEANKNFYEKTEVGKAINDVSVIEYDSKIAQNITEASEFVTKAAGTTAATVLTGGVGGVALAGTMGALNSSGNKAEELFQNNDKRDFVKDSGLVALSGVGGAIEGIAYGRTGAALKGATDMVSQVGLKNFSNQTLTLVKDSIANTSVKDLANSQLLKNMVKNTLNDPDFYLDTLGVGANNVADAYAKWLDTGEFDLDYQKLGLELGMSSATNLFAGGVQSIFELNAPTPGASNRVNLEYNNVQQANQFYRPSYMNIPQQSNEYVMEQLKYHKNNLDQVCKTLDDWGKNHGLDNYSEIALRKYVNTGSAYQFVNGGRTPYITSTNNARNYIESLDVNIVDAYLSNKILNSSNYNKLDEFFRINGSPYSNTFGVNQGGISELCEFYLNGQKYSYIDAKNIANNAKNSGLPIPRFKKIATNEYFDLKDKLIAKGLTEGQASVILSSIDDVGACSYAAKANSIFYKFSNNPVLFERKFGFPMYKVSNTGERILNSNELLLDMYMFANNTENGGRLFTKNIATNSYDFNCNDTIDVFGRKMLDTNKQVYMSTSNGSNNSVLKNYMNSKGLDWDSYNLITNRPKKVIRDKKFNKYLDIINDSINEGKAIQLNIFSEGKEIRMINRNPILSCTTNNWSEGLGHAVFVTGIQNDGFRVSSWGQEYLIPFADLQNGGFFNIMIDNINVKF